MATKTTKAKKAPKAEIEIKDTPVIESKPATTLISVLVLQNYSCEIAGVKLNLEKGQKVKLTPFQFRVLSNPNLTQKIVQAV